MLKVEVEKIDKHEDPNKYLDVEEIAKIVIGCAIDVHRALGPGLLESAYQQCLYYKIEQKGLKVEKEKALPLVFEEVNIHLAQVLTYLKLSENKLALLINFNVLLLKHGLKRVIL